MEVLCLHRRSLCYGLIVLCLGRMILCLGYTLKYLIRLSYFIIGCKETYFLFNNKKYFNILLTKLLTWSIDFLKLPTLIFKWQKSRANKTSNLFFNLDGKQFIILFGIPMVAKM